jgi:hypothetical protein
MLLYLSVPWCTLVHSQHLLFITLYCCCLINGWMIKRLALLGHGLNITHLCMVAILCSFLEPVSAQNVCCLNLLVFFFYFLQKAFFRLSMYHICLYTSPLSTSPPGIFELRATIATAHCVHERKGQWALLPCCWDLGSWYVFSLFFVMVFPVLSPPLNSVSLEGEINNYFAQCHGNRANKRVALHCLKHFYTWN